MRNRSASLGLRRIGKVVRRIKENIRSEQDLGTQVAKGMQYNLRSSMHLTKDMGFSTRSITRVMVGNLYSVGIVVESIT